jgi:hypothetical protein
MNALASAVNFGIRSAVATLVGKHHEELYGMGSRMAREEL